MFGHQFLQASLCKSACSTYYYFGKLFFRFSVCFMCFLSFLKFQFDISIFDFLQVPSAIILQHKNHII